nr:NAD(P)H-binding protein [Kibdelosporangium sp. MJ126-NF4]CEL19253.1 Oxidoreductase [Kibdelosporangium sp. MJ126-NF4]CTQ94948.1 Oxidoreductase [Kibdelosporangium sp. MJ126-NF4]
MTILVTGATGNVGRSVVTQLLEAGAQVRATSRNPESAGLPVEVLAADLAKPASFEQALDGVHEVFLFPSPEGAQGFVDLAKAKGVQRIVLLSSQAAAHEYYGDAPMRTMHLVVEQVLERSGIDWTFLRPGGFATNTLLWAQSIKDTGRVLVPYAESNTNSIHEADIAAVAVAALLQDGHVGQAYELTGPESLTQRRQLELIGAAIGREIEVVDQQGEEARAALIEQFGGWGTVEFVDAMIRIQQNTIGKPADLADGVQKVLGRPARTFAEWTEDHKADFTP